MDGCAALLISRHGPIPTVQNGSNLSSSSCVHPELRNLSLSDSEAYQSGHNLLTLMPPLPPLRHITYRMCTGEAVSSRDELAKLIELHQISISGQPKGADADADGGDSTLAISTRTPFLPSITPLHTCHHRGALPTCLSATGLDLEPIPFLLTLPDSPES